MFQSSDPFDLRKVKKLVKNYVFDHDTMSQKKPEPVCSGVIETVELTQRSVRSGTVRTEIDPRP